jgi:hypothetical protein
LATKTHPPKTKSKLCIPSTIKSKLRLWNAKLVSFSLAYFEPKKNCTALTAPNQLKNKKVQDLSVYSTWDTKL